MKQVEEFLKWLIEDSNHELKRQSGNWTPTELKCYQEQNKIHLELAFERYKRYYEFKDIPVVKWDFKF